MATIMIRKAILHCRQLASVVPLLLAVAAPVAAQPVPSPAPPAIASNWWRTGADPVLNSILARMHTNNTQIAAAMARLAAADARAHLGQASQQPLVGVGGSFSHAGGPLINKTGNGGNLISAGATISWEADLFGRFAGNRAAERLDSQAAAAMLADVGMLLEAATVRRYFQLRHDRQAIALAEQAAELWKRRQAIADARVRQGLAAPQESDAIRQMAIASTATRADLERDAEQTRNALALLVGDDAPLPASAALIAGLPLPPEVPADLPSALLQRRPDVEAARNRLEAARSRLEATRQNWLPSFSLTAAGGAAAPTLGEILSASARSFGLDLLFALPLFDGGRHAAQVAGSAADRDLAIAQYREAMLTALREVNDALVSVTDSRWQARLAAERQQIGERAAAAIAGRVARGTASTALLIDTDIAANADRRAALDAQFQHLSTSIDLTQAMRGSWQEDR